MLNKFLEEWQIPFYIRSREGKKKGAETVWIAEEVGENALDCRVHVGEIVYDGTIFQSVFIR